MKYRIAVSAFRSFRPSRAIVRRSARLIRSIIAIASSSGVWCLAIPEPGESSLISIYFYAVIEDLGR
jgi:hypothetical protein